MDVSVLRRTELFGLRFINEPSLNRVADVILSHRDPLNAAPDTFGHHPVVLTPNVDILVHLHNSRGSIEEAMFADAAYCLPDGQPIVLASRLLGERLRARLPGSGLFEIIWPQLVADDVPVIVVASSDELAELMGGESNRVSTIVPPFFDADDSETLNELANKIFSLQQETDARFILSGIGNPKDARLAAAFLRTWSAKVGDDADGLRPLFIGMGGSFDMFYGFTRRAPVWVQKAGLEWFFRFLQEPRRLFKRYFVRDTKFFVILASELIKSRRKKRARNDS